MPFLYSLIGFAVLNIFLAYAILKASSGNDIFWKGIHRDKKIGFLFGIAGMAWSGWSGYHLLGEDFPAIARIIPIAFPLLTVGIWLYLDYVFTRCAGGLGLLIVCELLNQAIGTEIPGRMLFSISCYLLAIGLMFMVGHPWRFRNIISKCREDKQWRKKFLISFLALNACYIITGILSYV